MIEKIKKYFVLDVVICIVAGLIMAIFPSIITSGISIVVAILLIVYSTLVLKGYFDKTSIDNKDQLKLVIGIIAFGFGVYLLINRSILVSLIPKFIGVVLIVSAIDKIRKSIELKNVNYNRWYNLLISAIILIIVAIILLAYSFSTALIAIRITGILLVISGIADIFANKSYSAVIIKEIQ